MKAVVQRHFGGTEQLALADVDDPTPGEGEVLVRVVAAGVDRGTWHLMTGLPLVARLGIGLRRPRYPIPGRDLAGVAEAVGPGVTSVKVGDEVVGTADGSFAELAVVPERRITRSPAGIPLVDAAVLPVSGLTALLTVHDVAKVQAGQPVLVTGASGGVGSYAVQMAAALGAHVTAVCSGAKADFVRELGATDVIDYAREEIDRDGRRYDVVIDIAGNRPLSLLRRCLADRGTLVVVGGEGGGRWFGGLHRQLGAAALSPFVKQRLTMLVSRERAEDMARLVALVEQGQLRPAVDRTFPLADAAAAIDFLASGNVRGKVAVTV